MKNYLQDTPSRQGLVHSRRRPHKLSASSVFLYCLYCFSKMRLLAAHLPDCSVHPEQKVEYPSPDDLETNIKKFKAFAKTLPVPFILYADCEAFLVPAEETEESSSNTKVRQLHKPSDFACLRISKVPAFKKMGKYLRTAAKIRSPSFSNTLKIRTATSEASCQT